MKVLCLKKRLLFITKTNLNEIVGPTNVYFCIVIGFSELVKKFEK